jgi:hypothetical protein
MTQERNVVHSQCVIPMKLEKVKVNLSLYLTKYHGTKHYPLLNYPLRHEDYREWRYNSMHS